MGLEVGLVSIVTSLENVRMKKKLAVLITHSRGGAKDPQKKQPGHDVFLLQFKRRKDNLQFVYNFQQVSKAMFKLNKADQEILEILKEVFLTKNCNPLTSDEHFRLWLIRALCATSAFGVIARGIVGFSGKEMPIELSVAISSQIAMFFGVLFLHINNKSENTSLIIFALTWISIVLGLFV